MIGSACPSGERRTARLQDHLHAFGRAGMDEIVKRLRIIDAQKISHLLDGQQLMINVWNTQG